MNHYPMWKNLLVLVVLLVGFIFALPNLFGDEPAVQLSSSGRGGVVDLALASKVEAKLKTAGLEYRRVELERDRLMIRFVDDETQLKAKTLLSKELDEEYVVALNLAAATPGWLKGVGAEPMNLGLDLRGGVHFLMEVDMAAAEKKALNDYAGTLRATLRAEKIRYKKINIEAGGLSIVFKEAEKRNAAMALIENATQFNKFTVASNDAAPTLDMTLTESAISEIRSVALKQNITTLRNRINELGVAEPTVQRQGDSRIVVQLPGVQDTAKAKEILGATATLEFRLADYEHDVSDAVNGRVPAGTELFKRRGGGHVLLKKQVMVTGEHVVGAASTLDPENGSPMVSVDLDNKVARRFSEITGANINKPMAVVFIESKSDVRKVNGVEKRVRREVAEVISVATIQSQLGKSFRITGLDSTTEARDLALLLRAGALAAPMDIVEERTVGPSLGKENIKKGFQSVMIGFAFVLIFMVVWYRVFGMVANLALAANLVLVVALLSMLQATLTLPGIAGIVLTVGMAVDANVLIFERIREELRIGNSPQASINAGYNKAFSTIADANITTLIAAIVLFGFGTGTIKGFAVTLSLGILTSMFTAIIGTRALVNFIYGKKTRPELSI